MLTIAPGGDDALRIQRRTTANAGIAPSLRNAVRATSERICFGATEACREPVDARIAI